MTSRRLARISGRPAALAAGLAATLTLGVTAGAAVITSAPTAYAAAAAKAPAAAPSIPGGPTVTFTNQGTCANPYTVPADIYHLQVVVVGGMGASGSEDNTGITSGGGGGAGAQVTAELAVTPGEVLNADVGENGSSPTTPAGQFPGGTWIGGAIGGIETIHPESFGGEGGGASAITNATGCGNQAPSSVLAIAGGGGGGGGGGTVHDGGGGGTGGHDSDGKNSEMNGGNAGKLLGGDGGGGATVTAGGNGGSGRGNVSGQNGGVMAGGVGGVRTETVSSKLNYFDGGGGGGGGWYGGGGGGEGGGGGGGGGGAGSSAVLSGTVDSIVPATTSPMVSITPEIVPPDAPTGVSAVVGYQQATVSFTPSATDGGSPIEYYTVYATASDKGFDQTATGSGSPITVTNLTAGQTYTFTVTATNQAGEGTASAPSNAVVPYRIPGAPKITSATAGDDSATVAFNEAAEDTRLGNPVTSYTVTARLGANVTSGPGITATGTSSPITVNGLTNGTNYTVTVYASNAAGNGPESASKVVYPQTDPGPPTNVTATNGTPVGATTGTVNLTFAAPADDGGRPIRSYTAVSSPGNITATANAGAGGVQVTGLTIGTSYTFTVYATSEAGSGPASDPSNSVTPTPVGIPSPPLTPAAATLDQAAYVSCTAPKNDGGSALTSYTVTSSPGGISATGSSCPILVTGLTDGTSYTFTVTATNADGGTSQPSKATAAITPHVPSGTPPANDDFANAQLITGTSGSVTGSNIAATLEPGEPSIQDNYGGSSVWYKWTVPVTGSYQFDTCSAYPDVYGLIGLFTGDTVSNATEFSAGPSLDDCPAGEAGATIVTGTMSAGLTLYIKFDGINEIDATGSRPFPAYQGVFTLEWAQQS
jgi:hypothetical protein